MTLDTYKTELLAHHLRTAWRAYGWKQFLHTQEQPLHSNITHGIKWRLIGSTNGGNAPRLTLRASNHRTLSNSGWMAYTRNRLGYTAAPG